MSFKETKSIYQSKAFIGVVIAVVVLAGASAFFFFRSDPKEQKTITTTTVTTAKPVKNTIAPLTGLVDKSGESRTRAALAIKIGNNPEARPQAGISEADIVYEEIVEGGITRYLAIFNSTVPELCRASKKCARNGSQRCS